MLKLDNTNLLTVIAIIAILIIGIVLSLIHIIKMSKLEKRFSRYSVGLIKKDERTFSDSILNVFKNIVESLSKILGKMQIFREYSKKYVKYTDNTKRIRDNSLDYVSIKILSGIGFLALMVMSFLIIGTDITFLNSLSAFLIGFYVVDIYLMIRFRIRKSMIEKDMLKAIIIMNNAFKSGLSIMQAIYMVTRELDGPIKDEFKKMYIDLSFGLSTEVVFERFTKRINTKEAKYITTSLNVLNKTGGNIVQVFASVERNSFTSKKLKEELGALTASAQAIFKVLIFIPILIFLGIFILNPTYFAPLFKNAIGYMLLGIMILLYIAYIIIIKKVMKVKVMI